MRSTTTRALIDMFRQLKPDRLRLEANPPEPAGASEPHSADAVDHKKILERVDSEILEMDEISQRIVMAYVLHGKGGNYAGAVADELGLTKREVYDRFANIRAQLLEVVPPEYRFFFSAKSQTGASA